MLYVWARETCRSNVGWICDVQEFTITWLIRPPDLSVVLGVNTIFVSRTDMLLSLSLSSSLLLMLLYDFK